MIKKRNKNIFGIVFSLLLFSIMLFCGVFALRGNTNQTDAASKYLIENIYISNGKFDKTNLDKLAQVAGYSGLDAMITAAEGGAVKTSEDFGKYIVKFGTYTSVNVQDKIRELAWTPTYLSKSDDGDAILTLWLASSENRYYIDGQDVGTWSDGTYPYPYNETQMFNGSEVFCDSYDGSYLRNYILNGDTDYVSDWERGEAVIPPDEDAMMKFTQFTTSELSDYIVTPSEVSWQRNANYLPNDPMWDGEYKEATKENYPCDWINDKLWLPSLYEVYGRTIPANCIGYTTIYNDDVKDDGGLWHTTAAERYISSSNGSVVASNVDYATCLRSVNLKDNHFFDIYILKTNKNQKNVGRVTDKFVVRPALHLNLTKVKDNLECDHEYGEWEITKQPTCTAAGEKTRTCIHNSAHFEKESVPALGHDFSSEFIEDIAPTCTSKGIESKHCSRCSQRSEISYINSLGHDWGEWETVTETTCTTRGKERRECQRDGCSGYQEQALAATGHMYGEPVWTWRADYLGATAKFKCAECDKELELKADVTYSSPTATCTIAGDITYTAKVKLGGTEYTDSKVVTNQTLPHNGELISTLTEPTCTADGEGLYRCKDCSTEYTGVILPLGHKFGEWEVTKKATYTEDGERQHKCTRDGCDEAETEVVPMLDLQSNHIEVILNISFIYGEVIEPSISVDYGEAQLIWYDLETGEELTEAPTSVGKYKLVVIVTENLDEGYVGAEAEVVFTITVRKITVTIKVGNSEKDEELGDLSAEVTEGSIVGDDTPYELETNANKKVIGVYPITGTVTNKNYDIAFVENSYIVSQKVKDTSGDGEVDLPEDVDLELTITQKKTASEYSDLEGLNVGYKVDLWYGGESGTPGYEFAIKTNCILTLKIPIEIIIAIFGEEEPNIEQFLLKLKIYFLDGSDYVPIDDFDIEKEGGEWVAKFNYTDWFSAEIVFNVEDADVIEEDPDDGDTDDEIEDPDDEPDIIEDPSGTGTIKLPANINVILKVVQKPTGDDYTELEGKNIGYWIELWHRGDDGTPEDEYTEETDCIITLKIPITIIIAIFGDSAPNIEKILIELKIYFVNGSGTLVEIDDYEVEQDSDGNWIVKINYTGKFRAEIVFNVVNAIETDAGDTEEPDNELIAGGVEDSDSDNTGLIIGISVGIGAAILAALAITIAIKRANGGTDDVSSETAVYRSVTRRQQQKINRTMRLKRKYYNVSDYVEDDDEE